VYHNWIQHPTLDRERGGSGEFISTVTPDRVLSVFDAVEGPITSGDVATELDCTTEAARRTLEQLYEEGCLARRRTAGRLIYWREDDESREKPPGRRQGWDEKPGNGPQRACPTDTISRRHLVCMPRIGVRYRR